MAEKRKKVVLTIKKKLEVVERFEMGESAVKLAKEYGIGEQTVRDVKKSKPKLLEFINLSECGSSKRKSMKKSPYQELDMAMLAWLNQKRAEGESITGPMCTHQAKFFHRALGLEGDFSASSGWLIRFKHRYGICEIANNKGNLNCDAPAINTFIKEFLQFAKEENLNREQIYNASETGLYWKVFPTQTLPSDEERQTSGPKTSKDRITIMCCSNATGQHKLKLVVIGKVRKAKLFKGYELGNLPVQYYYEKGAWMDPDIFRDWFHKTFVPQVRCHLQSQSLPLKAVLLLDDSPLHKTEEILTSDDGLICVKYLTHNVSSVIQPMGSSVMTSMKRRYRAGLKTLVKDDTKLKAFCEQTKLLDAVFGISLAWAHVEPIALVQSWKKILPDLEELYDDLSNSELDAMLHGVDGFENLDKKNLKEWLESDVCVPDHDDMKSSSSILKTASEQEPKGEVEIAVNIEDFEEVEAEQVSHERALVCIDTVLDYMEQRNYVSADLAAIKKIRDVIWRNATHSVKNGEMIF